MSSLRAIVASLVSIVALVLALRLFERQLVRGPVEPVALVTQPGLHALGAPVVIRATGLRPGDVVFLDGRPIDDSVRSALSDDGMRLVAASSSPAPGASAGVRELSALSPGLHVVGVRRSYLGGRQRESSASFLAGPFALRGEPVPCSLRIAVGHGVFDDLAPSMAKSLGLRLAAKKSLPKVERVVVGLPLVAGGIDVRVHVEFEKKSTLDAVLPISLRAAGRRALVVRQRGPLRIEVEGRLATLAAIKAGGIWIGIRELYRHPGKGIDGAVGEARKAGRELVRSELQREVKSWLPQLNASLDRTLPGVVPLEVGGARFELALEPCGQPVILAGRGVALRYTAKTGVAFGDGAAADRPRPATPGPLVRSNLLPSLGAIPPDGFSVDITEDLANAAIDVAWASGRLDAGLSSPALLALINGKVDALSDLRLHGARLALPPILTIGEGRGTFDFGELEPDIRDRTGRAERVVLGARVEVTIGVRDGRFRLGGAAAPVRICCTGRATGPGETRVPCFPELADALSELVASKGKGAIDLPSTFSGGVGSLRLTRARLLPGVIALEGRLKLTDLLSTAPPPRRARRRG